MFLNKSSFWGVVTASFPSILLIGGLLVMMLSSGTKLWGAFGVMLIYYFFCFQVRDEKEELMGLSSHNFFLGAMLLILSEVMFFFCFFWGMSSSVSEIYDMVCMVSVEEMLCPLFNTVLLVYSGICFVAVQYFGSLYGMNFWFFLLMMYTLVLGSLFLGFQMFEYFHSTFNLYNSSFTSIFYLVTSFHGSHVGIGLLFIVFSGMSFMKSELILKDQMEFPAWYWHFVDLVWIFLMSLLYISVLA